MVVDGEIVNYTKNLKEALSRQGVEDPGDRVVAQSGSERSLNRPDPPAMVEVSGEREEGHGPGAVGDTGPGIADEGSCPR